MKQLHIPTIGDEVTLAAPWTFTVHNEHRNTSIVEWMGEKKSDDYSHPLGNVKRGDGGRDWDASKALTATCTLPKGTVLRIDRIYIRRNLKDFDSVTFFLKGAKTVQRKEQRIARQLTLKKGLNRADVMLPFAQRDAYDVVEVPYISTKPARPVRFWAKLVDVNRMKIK